MVVTTIITTIKGEEDEVDIVVEVEVEEITRKIFQLLKEERKKIQAQAQISMIILIVMITVQL